MVVTVDVSIVNVVDDIVVVSVAIIDVSIVNVVDEIVVVSVAILDVVPINVEDKVLNGHCENKYENSRKGKFVEFLSSTQPFIEVMTKLCALRNLESESK